MHRISEIIQRAAPYTTKLCRKVNLGFRFESIKSGSHRNYVSPPTLSFQLIFMRPIHPESTILKPHEISSCTSYLKYPIFEKDAGGIHSKNKTH